jgi:hypothetical protein
MGQGLLAPAKITSSRLLQLEVRGQLLARILDRFGTSDTLEKSVCGRNGAHQADALILSTAARHSAAAYGIIQA